MIRAAFIWPNPTSPPAKRRAWLGKRPLLLVSALSAIVVATYPGAATVPDYAKRLFSQLTSGPAHSETTSPRAVDPPLGAVEASIVSEPEAEISIPGPSTDHREPEQKLTQPNAALSSAHSDALPVATDPSGRTSAKKLRKRPVIVKTYHSDVRYAQRRASQWSYRRLAKEDNVVELYLPPMEIYSPDYDGNW